MYVLDLKSNRATMATGISHWSVTGRGLDVTTRVSNTALKLEVAGKKKKVVGLTYFPHVRSPRVVGGSAPSA